MNIRKTLNVVYSTLNYYYSCCQGYCPTSKERMNEDVKSLASRFKAESHEETLTNVLEWQERNIEFWTERHPILTILPYISLTFVAGMLIGGLILVFFASGNVQRLLLASWFIAMMFGMLVGVVVATLTIMIVVLHSNRKFTWKEVPRGLKNIFVPSISVDFLVKRRLGICRDYAKFTACLLSNIYPNEKIYFAFAPAHAATGILIKNRLYMLDQRLPILTIEKWKDYRKPRRWHSIENFDFTNNTLTEVDKKLLVRMKSETDIDAEKLAMKMNDLLNIKEQSDNKALSQVEIPWKKGAILYEDNEMVNYSLARRLEMKISDELIRTDQITRIKVDRRRDDLVFLIALA